MKKVILLVFVMMSVVAESGFGQEVATVEMVGKAAVNKNLDSVATMTFDDEGEIVVDVAVGEAITDINVVKDGEDEPGVVVRIYEKEGKVRLFCSEGVTHVYVYYPDGRFVYDKGYNEAQKDVVIGNIVKSGAYVAVVESLERSVTQHFKVVMK